MHHEGLEEHEETVRISPNFPISTPIPIRIRQIANQKSRPLRNRDSKQTDPPTTNLNLRALCALRGDRLVRIKPLRQIANNHRQPSG
ncbi:hypothetical protein CEE69_00290 [Rhodopirellula bahusiensis]|uniref:Uncharacterized protein n=1 Tax=Rhodopirellula bahusiensis TaxID=2014065 RepID=A0A2G1WCW7_9BACT|nr:hypothetical protein CEE69_00290 [Rhodopirellula bahusiensis]